MTFQVGDTVELEGLYKVFVNPCVDFPDKLRARVLMPCTEGTPCPRFEALDGVLVGGCKTFSIDQQSIDEMLTVVVLGRDAWSVLMGEDSF